MLQEEHHSQYLDVLKESPVNSGLFLLTGFSFVLDLWTFTGATEPEILFSSPQVPVYCVHCSDGQTHQSSLEYSLRILNWWRKWCWISIRTVKKKDFSPLPLSP